MCRWCLPPFEPDRQRRAHPHRRRPVLTGPQRRRLLSDSSGGCIAGSLGDVPPRSPGDVATRQWVSDRAAGRERELETLGERRAGRARRSEIAGKQEEPRTRHIPDRRPNPSCPGTWALWSTRLTPAITPPNTFTVTKIVG